MKTWKIYVRVSDTHTTINALGENVPPLDLCLLIDDLTRSDHALVQASKSIKEDDSKPGFRRRSSHQ
jgi:hypothetical protein